MIFIRVIAIIRIQGTKLSSVQTRDLVKYVLPILIILIISWKRKYPLIIKRKIERPKKPRSSIDYLSSLIFSLKQFENATKPESCKI